MPSIRRPRLRLPQFVIPPPPTPPEEPAPAHLELQHEQINQRVLAEGWVLQHTGEGWRIVKNTAEGCDNYAQIETDEEALEHVKALASLGSVVHREALRCLDGDVPAVVRMTTGVPTQELFDLANEAFSVLDTIKNDYDAGEEGRDVELDSNWIEEVLMPVREALEREVRASRELASRSAAGVSVALANDARQVLSAIWQDYRGTDENEDYVQVNRGYIGDKLKPVLDRLAAVTR